MSAVEQAFRTHMQCGRQLTCLILLACVHVMSARALGCGEASASSRAGVTSLDNRDPGKGQWSLALRLIDLSSAVLGTSWLLLVAQEELALDLWDRHVGHLHMDLAEKSSPTFWVSGRTWPGPSGNSTSTRSLRTQQRKNVCLPLVLVAMRGREELTWNIRDKHFHEIIKDLVAHLRRHYAPRPRVVIWAHNSHLGDASATDMARPALCVVSAMPPLSTVISVLASSVATMRTVATWPTRPPPTWHAPSKSTYLTHVCRQS